MMDNKVIGQNLRAIRDSLGLNQDYVASYLDIKREMLSYYETGARPVPIPVLVKLGDLYGVDLKDFLDKNPKASSLNAAFAFRADEVNEDDLETLALFKRIARNYIKMKEEHKGSND